MRFTKHQKTHAFDKHYFEVHIPLARKLAGLIKYDVGRSPVISTTGHSDTYCTGTLHFDSLNAIKTAFASPEGQACAADRKILAPAMMMFKFTYLTL